MLSPELDAVLETAVLKVAVAHIEEVVEDVEEVVKETAFDERAGFDCVTETVEIVVTDVAADAMVADASGDLIMEMGVFTDVVGVSVQTVLVATTARNRVGC